MKFLVIISLVLFSSPVFSGGLNAPFSGSNFSKLTRNSTIFESDSTIDPATGNLIDIGGENRSDDSEDASSWYSLTRVNVSTNTHKSPINTLTADTLSEDGTAASTHYAWSSNVAYSVGSTYTYSMYVKPINRTWIRLTWANTAPSVYFNLVGSGTVGTVTGGLGLAEIVSYNIQKITTGWYRVSMTWIGTGAAGGAAPGPTVFIAEADNDVTFDGLNQPSIVVWGAQTVKNDDFLIGPGIYHTTGSVTKPRHDLSPSATAPVGGAVSLQGSDGNRLSARSYNGTNLYSKSHHDSMNIFDSDHTVTIVYERTDTSGTDVLFQHGTSTFDGLIVSANYTTGGIICEYSNNAVGANQVFSPSATSDKNNLHVAVCVRKGDYAKACQDGVCGTPVNVATYGEDASVSWYVGFSPGITGPISYVRVDAEGILDYELAKEREQIMGIKSNAGPILTNVIADGNMEAVGVGSWTAGASATLTKQTTEPVAGAQLIRIARNGVNYPYAGQTILTTGKQYIVTGWARSDGSAIPTVATSANTFWTGTNSTSWQIFSVIFYATATEIKLYASTTTGTQYTEFDEVVVREVQPYNWLVTRSTTATKQFSNKQLSTSGTNQTRVTGDGGGLEVEAQIQNKVLQSYDFNTTWTKQNLTSVSTNVIEDPFSTTTADGLIGTAIDATHGVYQAVTLTASRWTFSVYAKPGNKNWGYLWVSTIANADAYFDLVNCRVGTVGAGTTYAKAQPAYCPVSGICWCRISISYTGTAASHTHRFYSADSDGDSTTLGDAATINSYLFGAQVENYPVPSSYIPTTTAAITKNADSVNTDPHPYNSTNIILPETICSTCAARTVKVSFDVKCRYSSATEMASPLVFSYELGVMGNSGTASNTRNRLEVMINSTATIQGSVWDDASTEHRSVTTAITGLDGWKTVSYYIDTQDMSRMSLSVSDYSGVITYTNNSGTMTFDTTNTLVRVGQGYSGTTYQSCSTRNLQILLNQ